MNRKTMLIVDDVEINRAILAELFKKDFVIYQAENGLQALDIVKEQQLNISVVLLDIIMPVMDGFQFLKAFKKFSWHDEVPVVMITAENSPANLIKAYNLGVSEVVNKPFNPDIILRRVKNIVELYSYKLNLEDVIKRQVVELKTQTLKLKKANTFIIDTLSTIVEFRSGEAGEHVKRIRDITDVILRHLPHIDAKYLIDDEEIEMIVNAAGIHDIGKIAIPDSILCKKGKLTSKEYELMKLHTVKGCEILQSIDYANEDGYFKLCYEICRHHHERWDGSGYPDKIAGDAIPLASQVVALADVYDALTSTRSYKKAYSHEKAVDMIINGECGVFNPHLIECFAKIEHKLQEIAQSIMNVSKKVDGRVYQKDMDEQEFKEYYGLSSDNNESMRENILWLFQIEQEKFNILSQLSGEILFDYNKQSDTMKYSEKIRDYFKSPLEIRDYANFSAKTNLIYAEDAKVVEKLFAELTPSRTAGKAEIRLLVDSGEFQWFEVLVHTIWSCESNSELIGYVGKMLNIHNRKKEIETLKKQAECDVLTNVINKKAFKEIVSKKLRSAYLENAAMLFIDMDNFKQVNERFGHLHGDEVLKKVAEVIDGCTKSKGVVGRVGGDEFVVFVENVESHEQLLQLVETVCKELSFSYGFDGTYRISASVGVSLFPNDGMDYSSLTEKADCALYEVKRNGKANYMLYKDCLQIPTQNKKERKTKL